MTSSTETALAWRDRLTTWPFTFLLMTMLALVVAPLILEDNQQRSVMVGTAFLAIILFASLGAAQGRAASIILMVFGIPAAILQVISLVAGTQPFPQLLLGAFAAFLFVASAIVIRNLLTSKEVTWDKIQGAICAYMMAGVGWGLLYGWIALRDPQAFSGFDLSDTESHRESMIYYSFVTLTTLGYGDMTPVSHPARTLSWLEAVFGQIYLVVLVARLVSLHLVHNTESGKS